MGRWKTIAVMLDMEDVYTGDLKTEVREKYQNEELPLLGHTSRKRLVSQACEMAEKAMEFELPEEDIRTALIYFGMALDTEKYRLDIRKFEEEHDTRGITRKIAEAIDKRRKELRALLDKADEMISPEEWEQIKTDYRLQKDWKRVVTDNWHRVIVGRAARLAQIVISEGGTEEELRLALTYLRVCIDVNKYLLDYKKFKQERGIVELSEEYGIQVN